MKYKVGDRVGLIDGAMDGTVSYVGSLSTMVLVEFEDGEERVVNVNQLEKIIEVNAQKGDWEEI